MKIFSKYRFIMLGYLLLIKPGCISGMPSLSLLDSLLNVLRIVLVAYLIIVFVKSMKKVLKNRLLSVAFVMIISVVWEVLSSYLNGVPISDWGVIFNNLGIIMFSYMAIYSDYYSYLRGTSAVLGAYIILNSVSITLFPSGMYSSSMYTENYFLGYRTSWFAIYLFGFAAAFLLYTNNKTKKYKWWMYLVIGCGYYSMIMVWTATGLFCCSIGGLALLYLKKSKKDPIGIIPLLLFEGLIFYGSVILRLQRYASFLLIDILKKDVTLTERTRIWDNALYIISDNIITGIGRLSPEKMRMILGYGASHPHCRYLYITLCYGIFGIAIYIIMIFISCQGVVSEEKKPDFQIIMAAMLAMLTACQVESLSATGAYLLPLFLVAGYLHENSHVFKGRKKL